MQRELLRSNRARGNAPWFTSGDLFRFQPRRNRVMFGQRPLGPELLTNPSFDTDLSGWTPVVTNDAQVLWGSNSSIYFGLARLVPGTGVSRLYQEVTGLTIGAVYEVSAQAYNAGTFQLIAGTALGGNTLCNLAINTAGRIGKQRFTATQTNVFVEITRATPGDVGANFVSLRRVLTDQPYVYETMTPAEAITNGRLTFTRASSGWAFDNAGNLVEFASNVPRITNAGLTLEPSRTNGIRNNTMVGASAPSTFPTNWSNVIVAGLTHNVVGTGVVQGIEYIDVRVSGTPTGITGAVTFETNTQIAASAGQVWTHSAYLQIVGGSISTLSAAGIQLGGQERDAALLAAYGINVPVDTTFRRFNIQRTVASAGTTFIVPNVRYNCVNGQAVDFTLRIGLPQLELGASITTPIKTNGAAATRAAETAQWNYMNLNWEPNVSALSEHTLLAMESVTQNFTVLRQDNNNRIGFFVSGGTGLRSTWSVTGGTIRQNLSLGGTMTPPQTDRMVARFNPSGTSRAAIAGVLGPESTATDALPLVSTVGHGALGGGAAAFPLIIREAFITSRLLTNTELQDESLRLTT